MSLSLYFPPDIEMTILLQDLPGIRASVLEDSLRKFQKDGLLQKFVSMIIEVYPKKYFQKLLFFATEKGYPLISEFSILAKSTSVTSTTKHNKRGTSLNDHEKRILEIFAEKYTDIIIEKKDLINEKLKQLNDEEDRDLQLYEIGKLRKPSKYNPEHVLKMTDDERHAYLLKYYPDLTDISDSAFLPLFLPNTAPDRGKYLQSIKDENLRSRIREKLGQKPCNNREDLTGERLFEELDDKGIPYYRDSSNNCLSREDLMRLLTETRSIRNPYTNIPFWSDEKGFIDFVSNGPFSREDVGILEDIYKPRYKGQFTTDEHLDAFYHIGMIGIIISTPYKYVSMTKNIVDHIYDKSTPLEFLRQKLDELPKEIRENMLELATPNKITKVKDILNGVNKEDLLLIYLYNRDKFDFPILIPSLLSTEVRSIILFQYTVSSDQGGKPSDWNVDLYIHNDNPLRVIFQTFRRYSGKRLMTEEQLPEYIPLAIMYLLYEIQSNFDYNTKNLSIIDNYMTGHGIID